MTLSPLFSLFSAENLQREQPEVRKQPASFATIAPKKQQASRARAHAREKEIRRKYL
jgi:hypothetical protein